MGDYWTIWTHGYWRGDTNPPTEIQVGTHGWWSTLSSLYPTVPVHPHLFYRVPHWDDR